MPKSTLFLSLISLLSSSSSIFGKKIVEEVEYGVDYSFPMHRHKISINSTAIFSSNNDRQTVYDEYLQFSTFVFYFSHLLSKRDTPDEHTMKCLASGSNAKRRYFK